MERFHPSVYFFYFSHMNYVYVHVSMDDEMFIALMYPCIHVYPCVYMYIHVYTCVYMYTCIHVYVYTCVYVYISRHVCCLGSQGIGIVEIEHSRIL